MGNDKVVALRNPGVPGKVRDAGTEVLREGTQQLLVQAIWMVATRAQGRRAFDTFLATYEPKYPKATECLGKDRQALLAFYRFPGRVPGAPGGHHRGRIPGWSRRTQEGPSGDRRLIMSAYTTFNYNSGFND